MLRVRRVSSWSRQDIRVLPSITGAIRNTVGVDYVYRFCAPISQKLAWIDRLITEREQ